MLLMMIKALAAEFNKMTVNEDLDGALNKGDKGDNGDNGDETEKFNKFNRKCF